MAEFRKSDLISSDGLEVAAGTPGRKWPRCGWKRRSSCGYASFIVRAGFDLSRDHAQMPVIP
jgi:hypothetical protein